MQLGKMRVLEKLTVNPRQIGNDILLKLSKRNTKNDIISYSRWSTNLTYWFLAGEIIYRRFLHMLRGMTGVFVLQTVLKIRCWSVGWCKSISRFSINVLPIVLHLNTFPGCPGLTFTSTNLLHLLFWLNLCLMQNFTAGKSCFEWN